MKTKFKNLPKNFQDAQHARARREWERDGIYHHRRAPRFDKLKGASKKKRIRLRAIFADQKPDAGFKFPLFGGMF